MYEEVISARYSCKDKCNLQLTSYCWMGRDAVTRCRLSKTSLPQPKLGRLRAGCS